MKKNRRRIIDHHHHRSSIIIIIPTDENGGLFSNIRRGALACHPREVPESGRHRFFVSIRVSRRRPGSRPRLYSSTPYVGASRTSLTTTSSILQEAPVSSLFFETPVFATRIVVEYCCYTNSRTIMPVFEYSSHCGAHSLFYDSSLE